MWVVGAGGQHIWFYSLTALYNTVRTVNTKFLKPNAPKKIKCRALQIQDSIGLQNSERGPSCLLFGCLELVADADLLWEKSITGWLVASTDLMLEKNNAGWLAANNAATIRWCIHSDTVLLAYLCTFSVNSSPIKHLGEVAVGNFIPKSYKATSDGVTTGLVQGRWHHCCAAYYWQEHTCPVQGKTLFLHMLTCQSRDILAIVKLGPLVPFAMSSGDAYRDPLTKIGHSFC